MNNRTKKIIKRESSIIITILSLAVLFGLCIYPYNAFKRSKIHTIESMINSQKKFSDSLTASLNSKLSIQKKFSESLSAAFNDSCSEQNVSVGLWEILDKAYRSDLIPFIYTSKLFNPVFLKFLYSDGYCESKSFESFIRASLLAKVDSLNLNESEKICLEISDLENREKNYQSLIINSEKQIKLSVWVLVILFAITYPLRFIILAIKW
jgi:hypothetical protein